MSILTIQNSFYTQLKTRTKQRLETDEEMDEDSSTKRKPWRVCSFGKRNVLRFDLNESRESFCRRRRGRSFHVEGLKTEKVREPTVQSLFQYFCLSWQLYGDYETYALRAHLRKGVLSSHLYSLFPMCVPLLIHAIAHRGCENSVRESALKADSESEIPCHTALLVLHLASRSPFCQIWTDLLESHFCPQNECCIHVCPWTKLVLMFRLIL